MIIFLLCVLSLNSMIIFLLCVLSLNSMIIFLTPHTFRQAQMYNVMHFLSSLLLVVPVCIIGELVFTAYMVMYYNES